MCWSGEASTALAVVGIATTTYAAFKKEPAVLWITLGYFSSMELLQAFTYTVIDDCSNPANQVATLLGYLHIAFQPFFINAISMYFVPDEIRRKISMPVYACCFAVEIYMILASYPFSWSGACVGSLCSERLCSVSGSWHIAWELPLNLIDYWNFGFFQITGLSYVVAAFLLPILYGSWRFTLYHILMGPTIAYLLTDSMHEQAAVWCLISIALLLIVIKTPVRTFMHVRRWPFWFGFNKR